MGNKVWYLTTNVSTKDRDYKKWQEIQKDNVDFDELKEFLSESPLVVQVDKSESEKENEELRKANEELTGVVATLSAENEELKKANEQLLDDNSELSAKLQELLPDENGDEEPKSRWKSKWKSKWDKGDGEDAGK